MPRNPATTDTAQARELLRRGGLRATPQRLAVLSSFRTAGGHHLSAEDVWQRLRRSRVAMDRSTVYRVLDRLTTAQLMKQVRLSDGVSRFEIQEVEHHHAVCIHCGATEDVPAAAVHVLSRQLRRVSGFALSDQPLLFPGLCAGCTAS